MASMTAGYGQYCPLALAAELLAERWTILVISRLLDGCGKFGEIQRGVPRISPSLLSKRLVELERAGLIDKRKARGEVHATYALTPAGAELGPLVDQLAGWGQRWARDLTDDDLDPAFLAWSKHTRMNAEAMPPGRVVIEFHLEHVGSLRRFWIVGEDGKVDMCLRNPGFETDVTVRADLRLFVETWRGFRDLRSEIRARRIRVNGPPSLTRQLPDWLLMSALAPHGRERPGKERALAERTRRARARR
jgi:DNA-binding HxlR family transcriptional regulator